MERSEKLRQVIGECTERLLNGETLDIEQYTAAYPDLMPELAETLKQLCDAISRSPDAGSPQHGEGERDASGAGVSLAPTVSADEDVEDRQSLRRWMTDFLYKGAGASAPLPSGLVIPGYEIQRWLGRGAFGHVWLARHTETAGDRAVKLVSLKASGPEGAEGLRREARIMDALGKHRNRVLLYDCKVLEDHVAIVMEYVPGGPLSAMVSIESPMPWRDACKYIGDVAEGLVEVHQARLLHRDIKPANILLDQKRDEALLSDFGLAANLYASKRIAGTPGYASPELLDGVCTVKSDVFSLAASLFHLVAGHPPFHATDMQTSLRQAAAGLVEPVRALGKVPKAVEDIVLAGLEPDPEKRIDLRTFMERLRGAHLQSLVDRLRNASSRSTVRLDVLVWTAEEGDLAFRPVVCQQQSLEPHRGAEFVPEPSPVASVETGNLIRFEVTASADGFLTVLNLGSSGKMSVVFPNRRSPDNRVGAGVPHRVTVKMIPPPGTDRMAFIWTRQPDRLTPDQWRKRIEIEPATAQPLEATRDVDFVVDEIAREAPDAWTAEVVTIVHHLSPSPRERVFVSRPEPDPSRIAADSEDPRHPFPYLRLAVTRDYERIQHTIDKRYHMERQYENRPGMTGRYHKFCENVALIAAHNLATGYVVVRSQVDQIVERCLEPYEAQLLAMVQPHGNMIHPRQIQHLLDHAKKWGIDEEVVRPYFDQVIQKHAIRFCSDKPPLPAGAAAEETITRGGDVVDTVGGSALPDGLASAPPRAGAEPTVDPVDCSVYAPPSVARGETVMVQVFAHMPNLPAEAEDLARELDERARRRAFKGLEADVPRGERLWFHLVLPGLEVDDAVQTLRWQGRTESVQFGVTAPEDCRKSSAIGTVRVSLGKQQIPVGHVKFKLAVTDPESKDVSFESRPAGEAACRYRKAFISYASQDREEVMKRVQMLHRIHIDYFQDVLSLEPGQRWERELYRHIDECDLFLLFWSSNAKKSVWVLEETRYALRRKGGDDLHPPEIMLVIIEGPPAPLPPDDLSHLHFHDPFVYFLEQPRN